MEAREVAEVGVPGGVDLDGVPERARSQERVNVGSVEGVEGCSPHMRAVLGEQWDLALASELGVELFEGMLSVRAIPYGVGVEGSADHIQTSDRLAPRLKVIEHVGFEEGCDALLVGLGVLDPDDAPRVAVIVHDHVVPLERPRFAQTKPCGHLEQGEVDTASAYCDAVCKRPRALFGRFYTLGGVEREEVREHAVVLFSGESSTTLGSHTFLHVPKVDASTREGVVLNHVVLDELLEEVSRGNPLCVSPALGSMLCGDFLDDLFDRASSGDGGDRVPLEGRCGLRLVLLTLR